AAWRDALLACVAYVAITALLFLPLVRNITNAFPVDLGDPPNESWLVAWGVHALTTAPSQLLQGNIYFPHPNALVYNDNLLGLLPLSTPLYLLSGHNTAFTYNALYLLSFVMCGIFTFLLARRLTGSVAGAFLAGIIVAYSPYRMVHLSHLNQLSGQWLPLVLLFWERARAASSDERRETLWVECVALGVFFALQALCSIYYAAFLATCLLIYLAVYVRQVGWERARRFTAGVAVTGAALAAVLLPFFLPYLRLQGRVGTVRGPDQVLYFSADVRDFLHMPRFSALYGWTEQALGVPLHDAHQYLFPGLVAVGLAALGWRLRRAIPEIRIYGLILAVTAILSLGLQLKLFDRVFSFPLPFALLYDHVPLFHSFRDPARFFYIGFVCLALLAAWGMAALESHLGSWRPARRFALVALLCVVALAEYWINPIATPHVAVGNEMPPVYQWLKAQPAQTPVLELPIGQQDAVIWSHQAMMTYYATYHWQPIVNGVGGYTPDGYEADARILNRWPDAASSRLLLRWGVKYVIWHADWTGRAAPPDAASRPLAARFADGVTVYKVLALH
ncbi:MAG: hypothetical protein JWO59_152, partial [Chloroflexi bacterium]|nr:hypothetical protein [Chloroflexota bacterium]